jgi:hypothetical protein
MKITPLWPILVLTVAVSSFLATSPKAHGDDNSSSNGRYKILSTTSGQHAETYMLDKQNGRLWMMRGQLSDAPYLIPCIYQLVSGDTALSPLDEGSQTETTTDRFLIKSAASGQYTETYILDKQSGQVWMMRGQVSKGPYLIPCVYQLSSTRTALFPIDGTSTSAKAGERFSITSVSSGTSAETYVNDIQTGGAWKIRGQVSKTPFLIPCIFQLVSGDIAQTPMERNAEIRLLANKRSQTAPAQDSQVTSDTPQDPPPQLSPEAQKQLDDKFKKIDEKINEDMKKLFPK